MARPTSTGASLSGAGLSGAGLTEAGEDSSVRQDKAGDDSCSLTRCPSVRLEDGPVLRRAGALVVTAHPRTGSLAYHGSRAPVDGRPETIRLTVRQVAGQWGSRKEHRPRSVLVSATSERVVRK